MKPADFKRWRKMMGYSQKDAAEALGLKRRVVQYYEKGERDGETVKIPLSVRLACKALMHGYEEYHGPTDEEYKAFQAQRDKEAEEKKKKKKKEKAEGKSEGKSGDKDKDDSDSDRKPEDAKAEVDSDTDDTGGDDDPSRSSKSKQDPKSSLTEAA